MSLSRKITLNTFIATGARIIDMILAIVLIALLTRYLGKEGYGYYATILAYVHIFVALANLGLYNILLKDLGKRFVNKSEVTSNIFTLRLLGSAIIIPFSILVAFLLPYPKIVRYGISIAAFATFFMAIYQVLIPVFQKYLKIIYVSIAELIGRIIYLALAALLLLKFKTGVLSIVVIMVLASLIDFILIFIFANRLVKVRLSFDWKRWKRILKEALPVGAAIVFTLIYFRIDTIMLSVMKTPEEVGLYGLAYKILENLIFFPSMFVGFVVPVLSGYIKRRPEKFKQTFQTAFNALILITLPLVAGLAIAAFPIIRFLGGASFVAAAPALQILAFAIGLIFIASLYSQAIIILKKQFLSMWVYLSGAIINILANLYFIRRFSYVGAAMTTVATEFFVTVALIIIVTKSLKYLPHLKVAFKGCLAIVPMIAFLWFFKDIHILLLILASMLIYGIGIYLLGGVSKKELKFLFKKS